MSVSDNLSHGIEADAMLKSNGFGLELGVYMMKLKTADAQYGVLVQPTGRPARLHGVCRGGFRGRGRRFFPPARPSLRTGL